MLPTLTGIALGSLALVTGATAQQPTAAPSIEALARRLDTAHRPRGPVPLVNAFRCNLELHLVDARAEQGGQVDLAVQFMLWQKQGSKKIRPLMRYQVSDPSQQIVRGRDKNGPWHLFKGEPRDLTGAEFVQDLEQCRQHTNLAKQLLRFLSPGDVLRAMQRPGEVSEEKFRLNNRGLEVACDTVTGQLDKFPLLQQAGEDAPVQLKIYVDKRTGRLIAADVWPLLNGKPIPERGERILLLNFTERDGLLVPLQLTYLFRDQEGQLFLNSHVKLTTVSLRPNLKAADFDRR